MQSNQAIPPFLSKYANVRNGGSCSVLLNSRSWSNLVRRNGSRVAWRGKSKWLRHARVASGLMGAACRRIDEPFAQHLEAEGLEFLQFTFRQATPLYSPTPSIASTAICISFYAVLPIDNFLNNFNHIYIVYMLACSEAISLVQHAGNCMLPSHTYGLTGSQ